MQQHVSVEAPLEGEASAALGAEERLLRVGFVDGLVGFQLQQLGEGFPAVLAAQRRTLPLCPDAERFELRDPFGSDGVLWVAVVRFHLTED